MVPLIAFIFGSFIGSFLNVCIHRLPRYESVVTPPSRCYSCGTRVQWYDNLPVLSYLILHGRCRWCGAGFSPRYLVMELVAGALSAVVMNWAFDHTNGLAPANWLYLALGSTSQAELIARSCAGASVLALSYYLLVAGMIDLEHMIIPDELTKSFQALGPALAVLVGANLGYGDFMWIANWLVQPGVLAQGVSPTFDGTRFLGHIVVVVLGVVALLMLSLLVARWVYSRPSQVEPPWKEEEHRFMRVSVMWFSGCMIVNLLVLVLLVMLEPGPASESMKGHVWWPLLALHGAQALCGSLTGWLALYVVGLIGTVVLKRNAMGFGDVKFLAPIGAFLGPVGVLYAFFGAALIGTFISLPMRFFNDNKLIPFGPYLAIGSLLALMVGPRIHHWLFLPLLH